MPTPKTAAELTAANLSPLGEARVFHSFTEDGFSVEQVAKTFAWQVARVATRLRLLSLEPEILRACEKDFDNHVAQEIARVDDRAGQLRIYRAWLKGKIVGFKALKAAVAAEVAGKPNLSMGDEDRAFVAKHQAPKEAPAPVSAPAKNSLPTPQVGHMVTMWVEDVKLGCGLRQFVVLEIGAKWCRLYSAAALTELRVTREEFDKYAKPYRSAVDVSAIVDRNATLYDKLSREGSSQFVYDPRAVASVRKTIQMAIAA